MVQTNPLAVAAGAGLLVAVRLVGENTHRYPTPLTSLGFHASEFVNSDTRPRPTTHRLLAALRFGELRTREAFQGLETDVAARDRRQ